MVISIVVAVSENNAIGANGNLLWHLPNDMNHFKNITMGHHVVMGRKTYESIPPKFRPLPGRKNIIISRQQNFVIDGCITVNGIQEAITLAEKAGEEELMIIGGGDIYHQSFSVADKIYLTKVHHTFEEADTFFPETTSEWKVIKSESHLADEKHKYRYDFIELERN
jgi:dihydrofolate reductase